MLLRGNSRYGPLHLWMVHVTYGPPGSRYGPVQLWARSLMGHYIVVMVHLLYHFSNLFFGRKNQDIIIYNHIVKLPSDWPDMYNLDPTTFIDWE